MPTLYHHWLSPAARFIRILLAEKGVNPHLRIEEEWQRRPEFLALNPAGEVPVLIMEDGRVFSGTMAIAEYLEESIDTPAMIPGGMRERYEVRRLAGWFHTKLGSEVTRHLVTEKLLKRFLQMGTPDSSSLRAASHNLKMHLRYISHLVERRHYLAGKQFTLADAAAAAHLSVVDYFGDIAWEDWPVVKEWYTRVKSRRSVQPILSDRIANLPPPAHYDQLDY